MSRYYSNYQQYLGSQRCCDSRGAGPQGPQGPAGPASIGPPGTGFTGNEGPTGPTGRSCRGPTGARGATGPTPDLFQVLTVGNDALGQSMINVSYINANISNQSYPSIGVIPSLFPRMETISVNLTGGSSSTEIDQFISLTNNITGTINYMVFPSIYYGFSGSIGTYGYKDTANLIGNFIIHNRTTTGFNIYASKPETGTNINIYLNILVMYDTKGTDTPAAY